MARDQFITGRGEVRMFGFGARSTTADRVAEIEATLDRATAAAPTPEAVAALPTGSHARRAAALRQSWQEDQDAVAQDLRRLSDPATPRLSGRARRRLTKQTAYRAARQEGLAAGIGDLVAMLADGDEAAEAVRTQTDLARGGVTTAAVWAEALDPPHADRFLVATENAERLRTVTAKAGDDLDAVEHAMDRGDLPGPRAAERLTEITAGLSRCVAEVADAVAPMLLARRPLPDGLGIRIPETRHRLIHGALLPEGPLPSVPDLLRPLDARVTTDEEGPLDFGGGPSFTLP